MPLFGKKTPKPEAEQPKETKAKAKAKKTAKKEHVDKAQIIITVDGNEVQVKTEGCKGGLVKALTSLFIALKNDSELKEMGVVAMELVERHSMALSVKDLMGFLEFIAEKLGDEPKKARKSTKSKVSAKKEN